MTVIKHNPVVYYGKKLFIFLFSVLVLPLWYFMWHGLRQEILWYLIMENGRRK